MLKAQRRALAELSLAERRRQVQEANQKVIALMMNALVKADQAGDLSLAAPMVEQVAGLMGVRIRKSRG